MTDVPARTGNDQYPHLRKVGRYAFYLPCAFGLGILVSLLLFGIGLVKDFAVQAVPVVAFAAFLALRDLEKNAEARGIELARTKSEAGE